MAGSSDKPENPWLNLGFNLVLPSLILAKGDDWLSGAIGALGLGVPTTVFFLAILLPLGYGVWDFAKRRKWNFFSILGFVGVLLTGGIGLLKLPPGWVAVKEASIPLALGLAVLVSIALRRPLVSLFLLRPEFFEVEAIDRKLDERGTRPAFNALMRKATFLIAGSFFLSAILNFVLARAIVKSPAGSDLFNEELSRMMLWSYPVIVVPSLVVTGFALWVTITGLRELTGLGLEEIVRDEKKKT